MLQLILGFALACACLADPQAPPVFRTDVYVVAFTFSISQNTFRHGRKPVADLTVADFTIILDKKAYVPVDVKPDKAGPGHYLVSFSPPEALRDGKTHRIEVKVGKIRFKWDVLFPKPGAASQNSEPEDRK